MDEGYEGLVAAISHIDAAIKCLGDDAYWADDAAYLHDLRNIINDRRLEMLGNGKGRPFDVSDLIASHQKLAE